MGNRDVNARETSNTGFGDGNAYETQHLFTGDDNRASPADTNHDDKVGHLQLETSLAQPRYV